MSISCVTISQNIIDNTSWYFIGNNFNRGRSSHHGCGASSHKQRTNNRVVHRNKEQQQQKEKEKQNCKTSLPISLTNSAMLPGNGARKRMMTLNRKGSIAAFSISKSVEPNEELKVLASE